MHIETKHATRNENHSTDQHIVQVFNKVSMQKIATDHQISGVKFFCLSLGVFLCVCWGVWGGGGLGWCGGGGSERSGYILITKIKSLMIAYNF